MSAGKLPAPRRPALHSATILTLACLSLSLLAWSGRPEAASCAGTTEGGGSTESSATTQSPLPLQMARVGSAEQLIVATGAKLGDTAGTLQFFDYQNGEWVCTMTVSARFGKHGLTDGAHRQAGNKTTPTGLWSMPNFVFGYRAHSLAGTRMKYRRITKKSWWSSKRGTTYNTWVEAKRWPGEHLYNVAPQYELAVSTGYNAKPNTSVYGRGSGIFLHVKGKGLTAGCVAISRADMIRVCGLLDPAKHPAFAIGTLRRDSKTSIWAY